MPEVPKRYIRLVVADKNGLAFEIDQAFDITAKVSRSKKRDPDTADIAVYNLKKDMRHFIGTDAVAVELYAGTKQPANMIFKGEIIDGVSVRSDEDNFVDWITTIDAEDTKSKLRTTIVSRTYNAGTKLYAALYNLAAEAETQITISISDRALPSAMSFVGRPRDCIAKMLERFGARYQIIHGRMLIVDEDVPTTSNIPLINKHTGLIGVPNVKKEKGVVKVGFKTQLNQELFPGGLCHLETSSVESGRVAQLKPSTSYWIDRVDHVVESRGEFFSECECREV